MKIVTEVDHQLDQKEALNRAKSLMESILPKFQAKDIKIEENDEGLNYSCKSLGFTIKGTMTATPSKVAVVVDLPIPAMMYKSRVEKAVRKGLEEALL